jgi:pimeloyl-ACP methyl ester carboxylesterase
MLNFLLLAVFCFIFSVSGAEAAEPAWPIYWVKQTRSSPAVMNTTPSEKAFTGATPESVAQFNICASDSKSPPCKVSESLFFERIKNHAATGKPMIVFLHGCCSMEMENLEKAKELASKCSMPVIMFRWPAFGGPKDYGANEIVMNRCQGRALKFMDALEGVLPANQTILIGHSMGTRVLIEALDRRPAQLKTLLNPPYRLTILAAADAEAESFCQEIGSIARGSTLTVVLFHKADRALFCSRQLHQKFPRLGEFGEINFEDSKDHRLQIFDISDISRSLTNHDLPVDMISTVVKKQYAPLGLVCSKYYTTKVRSNTWTVTTKPTMVRHKLDPNRVLVKSRN